MTASLLKICDTQLCLDHPFLAFIKVGLEKITNIGWPLFKSLRKPIAIYGDNQFDNQQGKAACGLFNRKTVLWLEKSLGLLLNRDG